MTDLLTALTAAIALCHLLLARYFLMKVVLRIRGFKILTSFSQG